MDQKAKKLILGLLLITLCIYVQVLSFKFVNLDDPSHFDNNPAFSPLTAAGYANLWVRPPFLYMPVTYTFWALGVAMSPVKETPRAITGASGDFKFWPLPFHFFTLFFHLLSVLFVFLILKCFSFSTLTCFLGGLLFAVHPLQAEPVAWASGLKDTLSGALVFASLYYFLSRPKVYLSLALFILALCSKPSAVILPPVLFLLCVFHFKMAWRVALKTSLPYFLGMLPILWITYQAQATGTLHFAAPTFWEKWLVALDAIAFYAEKLFWPFQMAVDYGRTPKVALASEFIFPRAILVALSLTAIAYFLKKRKRHFELLMLSLALLAILPVLGFKPFSFQTTSTVSDRFMYLPLFFLILALSPLMEKIACHRKRLVVLGVFLGLLALRTSDQLGHWKDTPSLFGRTLEVNPRSWLAHNNLGSFYEGRNRFDLALHHYRSAASLDSQGIFYNNIGSVCLAVKDAACAVNAYQKALEINPLSVFDKNGLGFAYLAAGQKQKAQEIFRELLSTSPYFLPAQQGLSLSQK